MEQFNQINELDPINTTGEESDQGDNNQYYNINHILNNSNTRINLKSEKSSKKRKFIPYLIFLIILVGIITIAMAIIYIIVVIKYKENYTVEDENIYLGPKTLEHTYSSMNFENGIKIILGQVHYNDSAGGAIAFDKGYLNNEYKPGYLNLALTTLINELKFNKSSQAFEHLNNYIGEIKYSVDEDYSCAYFTIVNNGLLEYIKYFSELLHLKEDDQRLKDDYINLTLSNFPNSETNKNKRENHLLEFLIYGYKDEKGEEILPQGKKSELMKELKNNFGPITETMKSLLYSPSKIKITLFSHYKMSLLRKTVLRYFNILFKKPEENQVKNNNGYNLQNFATNKIIYYRIENTENNYLKINYYINNTNISDIEQLHIDSKYFNYIKDILQETKEGSLYYELTNNNLNMSIKSISCDIDIILKSKILFSIKIELNSKSYYFIKDIIKTVYEYMEKIKKHVNKLNGEDERIKELYYIYEQSFTFVEDKDDENYFAQKAKDLFYLDNYFYFLREDWIPDNFTNNLNKVKNYFNQLTMSNSVIILGINDYTKDKFYLNESNISFIFQNVKTTKYFTFNYSYNDLSLLNLILNSAEKDETIKFTKNKFISNYTEKSELDIYEEDKEGYFAKKTKQIRNATDTCRFYYFRDTSFGIPKVYISLFILHPFLRPNSAEASEKNNQFFQLILYISYLKDEINYRLADAIRAGSYFKVDFSENYIYIDIFCFSDIVHDIMEIIASIISDSKDKIENNKEIYREYAISTLNGKGRSIDNRIKLEFYNYIYDDLPFFNFYEFPIDEFRDKNITLETKLDSSIMQGYIYGYISEEESEKIFDIFKDKSSKISFQDALIKANLNNGKVNLKNFVSKLMNKIDISKNYTNEDFSTDLKGTTYLYKKFSNHFYKNAIYLSMIQDIFEDIDSNISVQKMSQTSLFLKIICRNTNCNKENIINEILKEIESKSKMEKKVDLIGNRFYYILKNSQNIQAERHDTLKAGAIQKSFENLYDRNYDPDKNVYFDIDFETFHNSFIKLNEEFPNFIKFQ